MLDLKTAVIILLIILGACIMASFGGYIGKKVEVYRIVIGASIVALIAIIGFVIFIVWRVVTNQP